MNYSSTRTSQGAYTLAGKYYTSDAVFTRETERIFRDRWLYAGRVSDLPETGSYFLYNEDKESIIVLRDREHEIRAFYNVCRHRGTQLCTEAKGRFSKNIQCPYHAWTYSSDGRLISAPNMSDIRSFKKDDYSLYPLATALWEGGVFVNFAEEAPPFEQAYAAVLHKFTQWHLDELLVVHRIEYDVQANWKLILQNYSECYHCPNLHPHLNKLTPYRNSINDLEEGPILGGPMRMKKDGSMTMTGNRCATPIGEVSGEDLQLVYYYVFFPNLLLSLHPDYVLIHRLERQGPDRTRVICEWLFHPNAVAQEQFDPGGAIEFWNITNLQDWHVCELAQRGVTSRAYTPGPYAELESMIAAFDREYLSALEAQ